MAAILADDIFKNIFLNENDRILIQISLKFVPRRAIDNKPALVLVMAWCRIGDKPLPEPKMTQITDIYAALYIGGDELRLLMLGKKEMFLLNSLWIYWLIYLLT